MHDLTLDLGGGEDAPAQSLGSGILTSLLDHFHRGYVLLSGARQYITILRGNAKNGL
ncbi:MAG TPA: hypothetical protein HA349_01480 [Methanotrichaceae archaeon]|nr:hypothetical protein [Methanotrichaceae archaeon]